MGQPEARTSPADQQVAALNAGMDDLEGKAAALKTAQQDLEDDVAAVGVALDDDHAAAAASGAKLEPLRAEVNQIQRSLEDEQDVLDRVKGHLDQLTVEAAEAVARYAEARDQLLAAAETWQTVTQIEQEASAAFERATLGFQDAIRNYELAAEILSLLAEGHAICATNMTTAEYRQELEAQGVDLRGKHVHHAWPHSRGGINNPANYAVLDARTNERIGNGLLASFAEVPFTFITGAIVSALGALAGCGE
jgi:chromosome segregation ATPase